MLSDWTIVILFAVLYWSFGLLSVVYLSNPLKARRQNLKRPNSKNYKPAA